MQYSIVMRRLVKFVTACSRPPLGGFRNLSPPFGIQVVPLDAPSSGASRLPTASTCVNLLKLPAFTSLDTMRQKLLLAIEEARTFDYS